MVLQEVPDIFGKVVVVTVECVFGCAGFAQRHSPPINDTKKEQEDEERKEWGWRINWYDVGDVMIFPKQSNLTQPPMVACKIEAQLEYAHIAYTFLHNWRRFACSVGAC